MTGCPVHGPARRPARWRGRGSSLVVVTVVLSVVFTLGVLSARLSLHGERSARNDRDRQVAFQSAEAALLDAEIDTLGPNRHAASRSCRFLPRSAAGQTNHVSEFVPGCGTGAQVGLCTALGLPGDAWRDVLARYLSEEGVAASHQTVQYGQFTGRQLPVGQSGLSARLPRYTVERVVATVLGPARAPVGTDDAYLVTAMGFGVRPETQVLLQTLLYKPAHKPGSGC